MTYTKEELELVAMALRYAKNEWVLADGVIHSDQWAEAFAPSRRQRSAKARQSTRSNSHLWMMSLAWSLSRSSASGLTQAQIDAALKRPSLRTELRAEEEGMGLLEPSPAPTPPPRSGRASTRSGWPEGYCPDCGSGWCRYREIQASGRRGY